jgi:hypothetical protein
MYTAPALEPTTEMTSTEQLYSTRPWGALSAKQRLWVETFIRSNGDAVLSTQTAFDCVSERNAKILSYEISDNPKIRAVLDLYYGRTERDSLSDRLKQQIEDGSLTVAQERGFRLLAELRGWVSPTLPRKNQAEPASSVQEASAPESRYAVGDVVLIAGKKCRVNEVNKAGRPVDVDEVQ